MEEGIKEKGESLLWTLCTSGMDNGCNDTDIE